MKLLIFGQAIKPKSCYRSAMSNDHEYALIGGINRSVVGRYIYAVSAGMSAFLVLITLTFFDLAKQLGWSPNLPPTALSILSAGLVYALLYALFSRFVWKWGLLVNLLKLPDISGEWNCFGNSSYQPVDSVESLEWLGVVAISQTWDKIFVVLRTEKSRSESVSAALISEGNGEYRLLYHYKNDPRSFQENISAHHGFADIIISKDLRSAHGVYFTGRGRSTHGEMKWERKGNGAAD